MATSYLTIDSRRLTMERNNTRKWLEFQLKILKENRAFTYLVQRLKECNC